jgi:hypothetical protein
MTEPAGIERRLTSIESRRDNVESRLEGVATDAAAARRDAAAARYLAAAHDRDLADLGVKVDANRRALNALGEQTVSRFDRLGNEMRTGFAKTDAGFAEVRAKLDQTAAGHEQIVGLLTHVISRLDE